jgi:hypothetical protein
VQGFLPGTWFDDAGDVYVFVAIVAAVLAAAVLVFWKRSRSRRSEDRLPRD